MGLLFIDYLLRIIQRSFHPGKQMVLYSAHVLPPGDVICLVMKPKSGPPMRFKPGQYCFINIEGLGKFEWHPFSISSAPGDEFLTFHIRVVGDWTGSLKTLVQETNVRMKEVCFCVLLPCLLGNVFLGDCREWRGTEVL